MINAWKTNRKQKRNTGQAIVIIALLMVALIAIAGMAIDGAGMMLLKRQTQNAADAGVLAAIYVKCLDPYNDARILAAAQDAATKNGFEDADVNAFYPPDYGTEAGNPNYVQVTVTKEKPKYLIQLVYSGPLIVTSRAVGTCIPPTAPTAIKVGAYATGSCGNSAAVDFQINGNGLIIGDPDAVQAPNGSVSTNGNNFDGNVVHKDGFDDNPAATFISGGEIQVPGPTTTLSVPWTPANWEPGSGNAVEAQAQGKYLAIVGNDLISNGSGYALNGPFGTVCWSGNCDVKITNNGKVVIKTAVLEGLIYVSGREVNISVPEIGAEGITVVTDNQVVAESGTPGTPYDGDLLFFSSWVDHSCSANNAAIVAQGNPISDWTGLLWAPEAGIKVSGSKLYFRGATVGYYVNFSSSDALIMNTPITLPGSPPEGLPGAP